ncbi:putative metalloprotease [Actinokineospora baliensis]|uniref:neutral zinc metallopeptidase n=1 Tax=Actinokineospora baliensis TaxID=547056 RepID=UPI00195BCFF6|nr:neutral zinc metallopeptidase [Actinokineospora baliensis]MBM7772132.1 putative metalloprotease [Actinokineospora baliensis]
MPVAPPPMVLPPYSHQGYPQQGYPQQHYQQQYPQRTWYGPPPGYAPMRPKSNTGLVVAISFVTLLLAGAAFVGYVQLAGKRPNDVGYSAPTTTAPSRSKTTTTTTTTSRPTRTTATTATTRGTTRSSQPTTTTQSGPQPVHALGDNPVFSTTNGVNVVTCNLPAWRSDPQSAQAFFTAALPCFDKAWAPVMQRANLPYFTPALKFPPGKTWSSACGTAASTWAAFYCGQDNTIYMPYEGLQIDQYGNKAGVYLALFSHEFAHHIQAMSGINDAYWDARYEAGDQTPAGLELSRRSELQAQCFGGMWFAGGQHGGGSITDDFIRDMLADGYTRGDWQQGVPPDHGSPQHYGAWQEHGFKNNRTTPCNTWLAAPGDVS